MDGNMPMAVELAVHFRLDPVEKIVRRRTIKADADSAFALVHSELFDFRLAFQKSSHS